MRSELSVRSQAASLRYSRLQICATSRDSLVRASAISMTPKRLFTPGPLNTSRTVKEAMLRDLGSRDAEFIALVRAIRSELLSLANVAPAREGERPREPHPYESILIQGSGTYGVESVLSSVIPASGKLLVLTNGAYGERIIQIAARHCIQHEILRRPENQPLDPAAVRAK